MRLPFPFTIVLSRVASRSFVGLQFQTIRSETLYACAQKLFSNPLRCRGVGLNTS